MKKTYLFATVVAALVLGACQEKPLDTVTLACGDDAVTVNIYRDKLVATIAGTDVELPAVISADGAKYSDEIFTLWNKGEEWTLTNSAGTGEEIIECTTTEQ